MDLPFINQLSESKLYTSKQKLESAPLGTLLKLLQAHLSSIFLLLQNEGSQDAAREYASKTRAFGSFDAYRIGGTDLYQVINELLRRGKLQKFEVEAIKQVLREASVAVPSKAFLSRLLMKIEFIDKAGVDSRLSDIRRKIASWDENISEKDLMSIATSLNNVYSSINATSADIIPLFQKSKNSKWKNLAAAAISFGIGYRIGKSV